MFGRSDLYCGQSLWSICGKSESGPSLLFPLIILIIYHADDYLDDGTVRGDNHAGGGDDDDDETCTAVILQIQ